MGRQSEGFQMILKSSRDGAKADTTTCRCYLRGHPIQTGQCSQVKRRGGIYTGRSRIGIQPEVSLACGALFV